MKCLTSFTLLLFISLGIAAQDTIPQRVSRKNSVYLELGGRTLIYSFNYERIVPLKNRHHFIVGAGGAWNPISGDESVTLFAISAGYIYGYVHSFELGANYAQEFGDDEGLFGLRVGYRYQRKNGFLFRIGVSPLLLSVGYYEGKLFGDRFTSLPVWPYLSFGYSF